MGSSRDPIFNLPLVDAVALKDPADGALGKARAEQAGEQAEAREVLGEAIALIGEWAGGGDRLPDGYSAPEPEEIYLEELAASVIKSLHMQVQETCGSYYCQSVPGSARRSQSAITA